MLVMVQGVPSGHISYLSVDLRIFIFVLFGKDLLTVSHSPGANDAVSLQILQW